MIKIEDGIGTAAEEKAAEEDVEGCVGKLMVYKSGKVKMRMGDLLLDVSVRPSAFHQRMRSSRVIHWFSDRIPIPLYLVGSLGFRLLVPTERGGCGCTKQAGVCDGNNCKAVRVHPGYRLVA